MTIARDPRTGAVLGQVCASWNRPLSEWPTGGDFGPSAAIRLLTRDGRYVTVPAHSVRLEELR